MLNPTNGFIVAKRIENKTGLIMPASSNRNQPTEGEVIAIVDGALNSVVVGTKIMFIDPIEVEHEGEKLYLIHSDNVVAIIK